MDNGIYIYIHDIAVIYFSSIAFSGNLYFGGKIVSFLIINTCRNGATWAIRHASERPQQAP